MERRPFKVNITIRIIIFMAIFSALFIIMCFFSTSVDGVE